jgi:hypothetical protein
MQMLREPVVLATRKPTLERLARDAPRPSNLEGSRQLTGFGSTVDGLLADAELPCDIRDGERRSKAVLAGIVWPGRPWRPPTPFHEGDEATAVGLGLHG